MTLFDYQLEGHVAVLTMNSDENRFNPHFLSGFLDHLDEIEEETDARTLVVTSSHEKIFSNGIDLEWLVPILEKKEIDTAKTKPSNVADHCNHGQDDKEGQNPVSAAARLHVCVLDRLPALLRRRTFLQLHLGRQFLFRIQQLPLVFGV